MVSDCSIAHGSAPVRISALATHPIQYHAPWFRALAAHQRVQLQVMFEYLPDERAQGEGFGVPFHWDVPLLEGYDSVVLSDGEHRSRWRSLIALGRQLGRFRPHVVLLTGWHSAVLLAAPTLAQCFGARTMVRGESNDLKPRGAWIRCAHKLLLKRYDRFLSIGSANRRFYQANGIDAGQIDDCPYFVDNDRFRAVAHRDSARHERQQVRRQLGVAEHETCFLFAGKLEAKKRPGDLIAALRLLTDCPVRVLFVGSGELEDELKDSARDLPSIFTGFVNQSAIAQYYLASDCMVLPSDCRETWGLVVNEAMACGRPAIVSEQVGCAEELIVPGDTGWTFPMGDVGALARIMREAAADRARLEQMGATAQEHVVEHFSVSGARDSAIQSALILAGSKVHG